MKLNHHIFLNIIGIGQNIQQSSTNIEYSNLVN